MRVVRKYGSALSKEFAADPFAKLWVEFKCDACGHIHDEDITSRKNTFRYDMEMRCPKCKSYSPEDRASNIKAQINKLTGDKSRIDTEIEKLERELNEVQEKPKEA